MRKVYLELIGRMGNNMFQLATASSFANKIGAEVIAYPQQNYYCPLPDNCSLYEYIGKYKDTIFRNFTIMKYPPQTDKVFTYEEPTFTYNDIKIDTDKDILLKGYFQSSKYFNNNIVKQLFAMPNCIREFLNDNYSELLNLHPVSIHVRRGDYLSPQESNLHPALPISYFIKAIEQFDSSRHFLITSDDTEWCKQMFGKLGKNFHVIENIGAVENLYLQTLCHGHIISNSTYSWWGAWLDDKDSKVVSPATWFGSGLAHLQCKDLIEPSWITI